MDIRHCYVPNLPGVSEKNTDNVEEEKETETETETEKDKDEEETMTEEKGVKVEEKEIEKEIVREEKKTGQREEEDEKGEDIKKENNENIEVQELFQETKIDQEQFERFEKNIDKGNTEKKVEKKVEIKIGSNESEKKVVIMAKHLCGVATDLALRSLQSFKIPNMDKNGK